MKKTSAVTIFLFTLFFAVIANCVQEGCYNEDACFKDYVGETDKETVLAVNRDTNQVELYWSDKDQVWIKPDEDHQKELQKKYNKKLQLREMQNRMNQMNYDTIYTKNQGTTGGAR